MNIPEILHQIETLLDDCGMDESCSDCLQALELQVRTVHDPEAHRELFQSLENGACECELENLVELLPDHDAHGGNPRLRLEQLIKALDETAHLMPV